MISPPGGRDGMAAVVTAGGRLSGALADRAGTTVKALAPLAGTLSAAIQAGAVVPGAG